MHADKGNRATVLTMLNVHTTVTVLLKLANPYRMRVLLRTRYHRTRYGCTGCGEQRTRYGCTGCGVQRTRYGCTGCGVQRTRYGCTGCGVQRTRYGCTGCGVQSLPISSARSRSTAVRGNKCSGNMRTPHLA
jgi:hypothetical protein